MPRVDRSDAIVAPPNTVARSDVWLSHRYLWAVHPLEYLRSVARDPSSADRPWEAATAFALLVADHGLGGPEAVPTARRLLERLPGRPELWWATSRIIAALDERAAAEEVLHAAAAPRPSSPDIAMVSAALTDGPGARIVLLSPSGRLLGAAVLVPLGSLLPAAYAARLAPALGDVETDGEGVVLVCERLRSDGSVVLVETDAPRPDCPSVAALA